MTEKLFHLDSYVKEFDATVVSVVPAEKAVILDRTAFYPGGGGQPSDRGAIAGVNLVGLRTVGNEIHHILDGPLPAVGSHVRGMIDWHRRHKLMRTHTAMHVLCGVVFRDYGALVTGGDMEPLKGRMDFEFSRLERSLVSEIEASVNREIDAGREVRIRILPRDQALLISDLIRTKINLLPAEIKDIRTVEIVGLDLQADGGTHVGNTAEVGRIRVADYKSKGAANKRIYLDLEEREPRPNNGLGRKL
jgi:misacylated tRNA(Ala) deacylase